jgi:hypothetical protein
MQPESISSRKLFLTLLWAFFFFPSGVSAQINAQPAIVRAEAVNGVPFGVGMISFRLPPECIGDLDPAMLIRTGAVRVSDSQRRILYTTFGQPPAARFFRNIFGHAENPTEEIISCWFLYKGDEPLQVTIDGCQPLRFQLAPKEVREGKANRLVNQWWKEYVRGAEAASKAGDYPDLIEAYLMSMLATRLDIPVPRKQRPKEDPLTETANLLMDVESIRSELVRGWFAGQLENEPADRPVPSPIVWQPIAAEGTPDDVVIEPMAERVPVDCFYFRFGTWDNQVWVKKLLEEFGGDLTRMVSLRGYQARVQQKFLDQLALESTQLDEWFGGNLIKDVAIIGSDTYFSSGPAIGVLLHASGSKTLADLIGAKRKSFAESRPGEINLNNVPIGGREVSLLSTLDNRYRSFHVVDGDFHLITNSRTLAEKFLSCQETGNTLGKSAEFRYIRWLMPVDRDDTIFAYLSSAFFQNLLTPKYQIELRRRSQVIAEMQMIQLARLAAAVEGFPRAPLEFLAGNRFLPAGFDSRRTASRIVETPEGWIDSIRGRRGFFLPIPDMAVDSVTPSEAEWFARRSSYFSENIPQLDPIALGIKRYRQGDRIERVVFDGRVAPVGEKKYGWIMGGLGEPLKNSVEGDKDELVHLQASLRSGLWNRSAPPHQLYAAIQDEPLPTQKLRPASMLETWETVKEVPGYLGSWPKAGALDWLPRLGDEPDAEGYTYSRLLELWRLQFEDYALLAFEKERLERLRSSLHIEPNERSAQVRLEIRDPSKSKLRDWVNVVNYRRSWQTSVANVRLLNVLTEQFGVPEEQARQVAEDLLDVRLVCSLGGEYRVTETEGRKAWSSSLWPSFSAPTLPEGYTAPLLKWFRGLELEVTKLENQFSVHGFIDIERETAPSSLPGFDLFKGFQNLVPGSKPKK